MGTERATRVRPCKRGKTHSGVVAADDSGSARRQITTVKEIANYLRVHRIRVYKLVRRNGLPGFRVGTDWRFSLDAVDQWCTRAR
jgi:excisionase family DNA binding protein